MKNRTRQTTVSTLAALTLAALFVFRPEAESDEPMIADLDDHLVAITTDFTGGEVLLFGSVEGEGDVLVVVHGPRQNITVRKKARVAGIWINNESLEMQGVPAFYHFASSGDGTPDLPQTAMRRHQIGVENIRVSADGDVDPGRFAQFRRAIIRNKQRVGHYTREPGIVERRGGKLFRTNVFFPANVPVGTYTVETMLVRGGEVASAQTTPLFVSKVGLGARIFRLAHTNAAIYGIAAILIAGIVGFFANWAFRRF